MIKKTTDVFVTIILPLKGAPDETLILKNDVKYPARDHTLACSN